MGAHRSVPEQPAIRGPLVPCFPPILHIRPQQDETPDHSAALFRFGARRGDGAWPRSAIPSCWLSPTGQCALRGQPATGVTSRNLPRSPAVPSLLVKRILPSPSTRPIAFSPASASCPDPWRKFPTLRPFTWTLMLTLRRCRCFPFGGPIRVAKGDQPSRRRFETGA
jgi:hypothetical protein